MINILKNQKGQVVSMVTFFVLIIMLSMALTMSFLISSSQKNVTNDVKSSQSYYAAESGIEDALLRLKKNPAMTTLSYNFTVGGAGVSVVIPNTIAGSKSITSEATNSGIVRNVQAVTSISNGYGTSFYYGIEVGAGGLSMTGGTEVAGNIFSGGNISGSGTIDNNAVVSGNGNSISGVTVKGDALTYSCLSGATINGNLTYVTGGTHTCTVKGTTTSQSQEISQQPMPIPQSQITDWENTAMGSGSTIYNGNYSLSGTGTASLLGPGIINGSVTLSNSAVLTTGPIEITGSLTLNGASKLIMKGVIYVKGNITLNNSGQIDLDSTYGSLGGIIIADGIVNTGGSGTFKASGQTGSYILVISNSNSSTAITVANSSSTGAAFYTTTGTLYLSGSVSLTEATGYAVNMVGGSKIQYSTGVVNIYFASGPGASWQVTSWQEQ